LPTSWIPTGPSSFEGHTSIIERLGALHPEGLGLSVVELAELYEGVYYSRDSEESERQLNDFLDSVTIVGLDDETARLLAESVVGFAELVPLLATWTSSLPRLRCNMISPSSATIDVILTG
jgi:hypothetical protein